MWVAECLEELEGKPLGPAAALDALGGPLPEQVKIRKVRQEIEKKSQHPAVIAAVSAWPEGGGSGVTFKVCCRGRCKGGGNSDFDFFRFQSSEFSFPSRGVDFWQYAN